MKTRILTGFVLAVSTAAPVLAQQTELEEIVVTAQRCEQSLQEAPISVTAFSGKDLERSNISEATQYL